jgi:hypothetical protein
MNSRPAWAKEQALVSKNKKEKKKKMSPLIEVL